jgi:hypothetical protein
MRTLTIKGFETDAQAEEFAKWYIARGEQEFGTWLEYSDIGVSFIGGKSQSTKNTPEGVEFEITID